MTKSTKPTAAQRAAYAIEAVRSDFLEHLDDIDGAVLASPAAFCEHAEATLSALSEYDETLDSSLLPRHAIALHKELNAAIEAMYQPGAVGPDAHYSRQAALILQERAAA